MSRGMTSKPKSPRDLLRLAIEAGEDIGASDSCGGMVATLFPAARIWCSLIHGHTHRMGDEATAGGSDASQGILARTAGIVAPSGDGVVEFTIPLKPATKKTSQRVVRNRATGKPLVIPSQRTLDYTRAAQVFLKRAMKGRPLFSGPVRVEYWFSRSDGRADLGGLEANLDDALQGTVLENDRQIISRTSRKDRLDDFTWGRVEEVTP